MSPLPFPNHAWTPDPAIFISELVFMILAVILCLAIYFKTKEVYELTKHDGIKYFRHAFLFFGLSYLIGFFSSMALFSMSAFGFIFPREIFGPLFILPLGYLSTMAILYLIFSSIWKNVKNTKTIILSHVVAIILTIVTFLTRSHLILLYLQTVLFILAIIIGIITAKHKNKISQIRASYFLMLGLWLINLLILSRRGPINPDIQIFFEVVSLATYIFIYIKISKWVK